MSITEPEKRSAVVIGKVFFTCVCCDKTVLINIVLTAVSGADNSTCSAVKRSVFGIRADGLEMPITFGGTNEPD